MKTNKELYQDWLVDAHAQKKRFEISLSNATSPEAVQGYEKLINVVNEKISMIQSWIDGEVESND